MSYTSCFANCETNNPRTTVAAHGSTQQAMTIVTESQDVIIFTANTSAPRESDNWPRVSYGEGGINCYIVTAIM